MKKIPKNYFPTLNSAIAYYDPYSFCIFLNKISMGDLPGIMKNPTTSINIEHIKTVNHEARHFADHIGTLWGQKYLLSYLKAINVRIQSKEESFPLIIQYCNQVNQMFYIKYYTEEYNYIPVDKMDRRWKWSSTSGLRFTASGAANPEAPLPMIHFSTYDDFPLVRIPLSITSLLETNATNEELKLHLGYLSTFSESERPIQLKFFEQETLYKLIYNQDLALYTVAVHLTANLLNLSDVALCFRISSQIATLALNLPVDMVITLPIPNYFEVWGDRSPHMLNNNEYGFIFYLLLYNYKNEFEKTKEFSIDALLKCSHLPAYEVIEKSIEQEMIAIHQKAMEEENLSHLFANKMEQGRMLFKESGLCFEKKSIFETLSKHKIFPAIFCNDTDITLKDFHPSDIAAMRPFKDLILADWYNFSDYIGEMMNGFYEVRGV